MASMTLRTPDVPKIVDSEVVICPEIKAEIEKLLKDVVKNAFQEVLNELKKTPLASLDANADGVISVTEAKDAAQKICCAIV